jgi:hypothetical protein
MRRRAHMLAVVAAALCLGIAAAARAAPPTVSYAVSGTPGDNGWFVTPVTVAWSVNFNGLAPIATAGCEAAVRIAADTRGTVLTCRAQNGDGTTVTTTRAIKVDATAPAVTAAAAARPPDAGTWYRAPVAVTWSGTDGTSGVAGCTALTYAGPDGPAAPTGTCRDNAGNVSAPLAFRFSYDATPPALAGVTVIAADTAATVRWQASPDAAITVTRAPGASGAASSVVYRGSAASFEDTGLRNGVRYEYTVTAADAAGNAVSATAGAQPETRLRGPAAGARVTAPPVLRWRAVPAARYYNVQLFRGTTKVLSMWPVHAHLRLRPAWRYAGVRRRLAPGIYRWFVWPGFGRRAQKRYGALIGTRRFVVVGRGAMR